MNSDTQLTRVFLTKHVERIEMEPDGRTYIASGKWNLLGEIRWDGAEGPGTTTRRFPFEILILPPKSNLVHHSLPTSGAEQ